jgi:hypothetical protein
MNEFLKSVLKTVVYLLEQFNRVPPDMRDRAGDGVDRTGERGSDLRDRTRNLYAHESHTLRNAISFAAGVGLGIGAGMLLAPATGRETRDSIRNTVRDIGAASRGRFASEVSEATGTEGS